jgi:hypothetical protein
MAGSRRISAGSTAAGGNVVHMSLGEFEALNHWPHEGSNSRITSDTSGSR